MKNTKEMQTAAEFIEVYNQLTPENKAKVDARISELLKLQEPGALVYYFESPDAIIGGRYMNAREVTDIINGVLAPTMTEKEIIRAAANYEADLYRAELSESGKAIKETCIYSTEV